MYGINAGIWIKKLIEEIVERIYEKNEKLL